MWENAIVIYSYCRLNNIENMKSKRQQPNYNVPIKVGAVGGRRGRKESNTSGGKLSLDIVLVLEHYMYKTKLCKSLFSKEIKN